MRRGRAAGAPMLGAMTRPLDETARAALDIPGVASAAIFVARQGSSDLDLVGAAGIEGAPLEGLVAAVRNPVHPIVRSMSDPRPTFNVTPMNPGGPALRSHLPFGGRGVLALAHEPPLDAAAQRAAEALAASAAELLPRAS
jgi:hypothetical protein